MVTIPLFCWVRYSFCTPFNNYLKLSMFRASIIPILKFLSEPVDFAAPIQFLSKHQMHHHTCQNTTFPKRAYLIILFPASHLPEKYRPLNVPSRVSWDRRYKRRSEHVWPRVVSSESRTARTEIEYPSAWLNRVVLWEGSAKKKHAHVARHLRNVADQRFRGSSALGRLISPREDVASAFLCVIFSRLPRGPVTTINAHVSAKETVPGTSRVG